MIKLWRFLRDFPELWSHHCAGASLTHQRLGDIETRLRVLSSGVGRLVSKLDPLYSQHEVMPDAPGPALDAWKVRKVESDRIGDEVIDRLVAEDKARRHTTGDL